MVAIGRWNKTLTQKSMENQGFTLPEIAIIIALVGVFIGAIWIAAYALYKDSLVNKAQTELLQIVQAIRALPPPRPIVHTVAGRSETAALIAANVFPSEMVQGSTVTSPWPNSTVVVFSATQPNGVAGDSMQVRFVGISQFGCIALATRPLDIGRDASFVDIGIAAGAVETYVPPTNTAFPIPIPLAIDQCTGTTDTIAFTFSLQPISLRKSNQDAAR